MSFDAVTEFENQIAEFFGAPYALAVDSCTHALELCLRYEGYSNIEIPRRTYISVPMIAIKLGIDWSWNNDYWQDYYYLGGTNIIDAAVLWRQNSYVPGTYMCLSFQFQKHLSLGRGGMILMDSEVAKNDMDVLSYDGRLRNIPWREQNISTVGYHYYMTPETAQLGLDKLPDAIATEPRIWDTSDYPDLRNMEVFNK
jgi:dTDP-4-amino-4,6-dideoxygalactose transaminase